MTVVIAARNAEATISAAVSSALAAPRVVQVVVVDDASDDATRSIVRDRVGADSRVELVTRRTRGGPAAARNDGLARARGARTCFLDADDALMADGIAALAAALDGAPGTVGALGRFAAVDAHGDPVDVGRWATDQLHPVVRRDGALVPSADGLTAEALVTRLVSPPPGAWLLDTATVRALGGFDARARRSEDLELLVRVAGSGRIATVDADVLAYLRHDRQRSAATPRRRWGRGYAMWLMLRAAPGRAQRRALARGMVAYHLDLVDLRWHSRRPRVRAMAVRNLCAAAAVAAMAGVAAIAPRRLLPAMGAVAVDAVD